MIILSESPSLLHGNIKYLNCNKHNIHEWLGRIFGSLLYAKWYNNIYYFYLILVSNSQIRFYILYVIITYAIHYNTLHSIQITTGLHYTWLTPEFDIIMIVYLLLCVLFFIIYSYIHTTHYTGIYINFRVYVYICLGQWVVLEFVVYDGHHFLNRLYIYYKHTLYVYI